MKVMACEGQSNMPGHGPLSEWSKVVKAPIRNVWTFDYDKRRWKLATPNAQGDRVGPCVPMAMRLAEAGHYVGIVPCAVAGSKITDWGWSHVDGTPYKECLSRLADAQRTCPGAATGNTCPFAGIFHWQGISDADTIPRYRNWLSLTHSLFANYRHDLGNLNLPIVYVQLGHYSDDVLETYPYVMALRGKQAELAKTFSRGVQMVSTYDLPFEPGQIHYEHVEPYVVIGRRAGDAFLNLFAKAKQR